MCSEKEKKKQGQSFLSDNMMGKARCHRHVPGGATRIRVQAAGFRGNIVCPLIMAVLLVVTTGVAAMTFSDAAEALRAALAADSPLPSVPLDAPCRPRMVTPFHRPTCVSRARATGTNRYGLIGDDGRDPSGAVLPAAWQVGVGWGLALLFSFSSPPRSRQLPDVPTVPVTVLQYGVLPGAPP
jgi:hypothetical protein